MPQDTFTLKGFFAYGNLPSNTEFEIAPLGELSVHSETYSKDRQLFSTAVGLAVDDTSANLTVFTSKTADGTKVPVPAPYGSLLLSLGQWVHIQASSGAFTSDPEVFRQALLTEFNGKITTVTVGVMVQQGVIFLPENLTFYIEPDALGATWGAERTYLDLSRIKLWFADAAFSTQFDEFEIDVIAPLTNLNDFFNLASTVNAAVSARSIPLLMQTIQAKAGLNPYTVLKSIDFEYHDPLDPTNRFNTTWSFLIYGAAGESIDAIKNFLVPWILGNSTHTREEWVQIFPDIFTSTEFILTPLWNQYAIPNRTLQEGVYSPTTNVANATAIALATCVGTAYTSEYVLANIDVVGSTYKSLSFIACGGPENRDAINRFEAQWPDYISVSTTNIDFNRMSPDTQDWVGLLYSLLLVAENLTESSDIPIGMSRTRRVNGQGETVLYVTSTFQNVQYLVVGKPWLTTKFPPVNPDPNALALLPAVQTFVSDNGGRVVTQFSATGGLAPYNFTATSIDLIAGQIDPLTGAFDGTFGRSGFLDLRVDVTDANSVTTGLNYTIEVSLA